MDMTFTKLMVDTAHGVMQKTIVQQILPKQSAIALERFWV